MGLEVVASGYPGHHPRITNAAERGQSRGWYMGWTRWVVGATGALVLGAPAGAQQRDTVRTDTMVFRIEEIRVQARRPVTTVGGASAIEVTVDSLGLSAAPTVEEVLREIPSVHVRTNSRGESEISVRGSESRQVALLVDGVPISLGWDARTDVSVLPAAAAHEVTLVRGLSSILHGPNVLGGVVEMKVPESPGRTFKPKVTGFEPNRSMLWVDGFAPMFVGKRSFALAPNDNGTTPFTMSEVFSVPHAAVDCRQAPKLRPDF